MYRGTAGAVALFCVCMSASLQAACTASDPGMLHLYTGTIGGKYPIRLTLDLQVQPARGVYFYVRQLSDLRLESTGFDGEGLQLDEYTGEDKRSGQFRLHFLSRDPGGRYGDSALSCEVLVGEWLKPDGSSTLPVRLDLESISAGPLEQRYAVAGASSDELIHRKARAFWEALRAEQHEAVGAALRYPLEVQVNGTRIRLKNAAELEAHYAQIFDRDYRERILAHPPRHMFANGDGIMLGNGEVWFNAQGQVMALNRE